MLASNDGEAQDDATDLPLTILSLGIECLNLNFNSLSGLVPSTSRNGDVWIASWGFSPGGHNDEASSPAWSISFHRSAERPAQSYRLSLRQSLPCHCNH